METLELIDRNESPARLVVTASAVVPSLARLQQMQKVDEDMLDRLLAR